MTTAHNLLDEPLLSWRDSTGERRSATLPGILEKLATEELEDFPRVRPHQFHAWSMFLTQLAATMLNRVGRVDPRLSESEWREILIDGTEGEVAPWCLVVGDLAKPAFFQSPVPEGSFEAWKRSRHPDDMDMLVTAKNHDVKTSSIAGDDVESWIMALVTLQTMQGYSGGAGGYKGIARMNGGYGSRPRVGLSNSVAPGGRFSRDVATLLRTTSSLAGRGFNEAGLSLGWLAPWDGASIGMSKLAPHFIEVCRRVRCYKEGYNIACAYTTSKGQRFLPEIEGGDIGDPWIPVRRADGTALTVGSRGFNYQLLSNLLYEIEYAPGAAQEIVPGDGDPVFFYAAVMARGKSKTEGLHERTLFLTGNARLLLGRADSRATTGKRATANIEQAKTMRHEVLLPALRRLSLGGDVARDRFDERVDEVFFSDLFASLDNDEDDATQRWEQRLSEIAWEELQLAIDTASLPSARRYKAISGSEMVYWGRMKKHFPGLVASAIETTTRGEYD